jgi:hypothetical protein
MALEAFKLATGAVWSVSLSSAMADCQWLNGGSGHIKFENTHFSDIETMARALNYFVGSIACFGMAISHASLTSEAVKALLNAEKNVAAKETGLIAKLLRPTSSELSLIERYGEKVRNKVRKDSLKCVGNRIRDGQTVPSQKKMSRSEKEEHAKDQCFSGFMKCMDISYKNIQVPNAKMLDRCIGEINTKFEKYRK